MMKRLFPLFLLAFAMPAAAQLTVDARAACEREAEGSSLRPFMKSWPKRDPAAFVRVPAPALFCLG